MAWGLDPELWQLHAVPRPLGGRLLLGHDRCQDGEQVLGNELVGLLPFVLPRPVQQFTWMIMSGDQLDFVCSSARLHERCTPMGGPQYVQMSGRDRGQTNPRGLVLHHLCHSNNSYWPGRGRCCRRA